MKLAAMPANQMKPKMRVAENAEKLLCAQIGKKLH